ncbi:hypothetical protein V8C86DRAFT_2545266 [Haematococcus lacustris]
MQTFKMWTHRHLTGRWPQLASERSALQLWCQSRRWARSTRGVDLAPYAARGSVGLASPPLKPHLNGTATLSGDDDSGIQVLEGLEPVRKRPGMYVGGTGEQGLHHLVYEILDNAIDEIQNGHATGALIDLDVTTGWVTITDNGRGISPAINRKYGMSGITLAMTRLHAGGKFGGENSNYKVSGGLHGVGLTVVNALSERCEVKVWRNGVEYWQCCERGEAVGDLQQAPLPPPHAHWHGTQVRFRFDSGIFAAGLKYNADIIRTRIRELAHLNSGATLVFRGHDQRTHAVTAEPGTDHSWPHTQLHQSDFTAFGSGEAETNGVAAPLAETDAAIESSTATSPPVKAKALKKAKAAAAAAAALLGGSLDGKDVGHGWQVYRYRGGLQEYVTYMTKDKKCIHDVVYLNKAAQDASGRLTQVEVALQWCEDSYRDDLVSFVNCIRTPDGGTHLEGLKVAITRTVNNLAKKLKLVKDGDAALTGENIREGLSGAISVKLEEVEFEGQTKNRLGNPEVRGVVDGLVTAAATEWLETHPAALRAIVDKAVNAAKAADAAKKARDLVRRKNVLTKTMLPGKLADCTSSKREDTEIFIVEGDSAGGSAKQARDRFTQAILPLRGKILNVERKDDASILQNAEISNVIVALGLGSKEQGSKGLRYGKVIILTDADVDGAHIRTLLLTFLFRYRRELYEEGRVFMAVPPLYKLEVRGQPHWCFTEAELAQKRAGLPAGVSSTVQRFKGLGEMMPQQLWDTTLNPATRLLRRLTIEDAHAANEMIHVLMGSKVGPRRKLIEDHGSRLSVADLDI